MRSSGDNDLERLHDLQWLSLSHGQADEQPEREIGYLALLIDASDESNEAWRWM